MDGVLDFIRHYSYCDACKTGYDTDYHAPMALPCLHAICKKCLMEASDQMVECPHCKLAPNGLRISAERIKEDSFRKRISNSLRISRSEVPCTDCPDNARAKTYCAECRIYLCNECSNAHRRNLITKKHNLETPINDVSGSNNADHKTCSVSGHEKEMLEYYCTGDRCQTFICSRCFDRHTQIDGHIVLTLHDALGEYRNTTRTLLGDLEETVVSVNTIQTKINRELLDIEIKENEALRDVEMAFGSFRRVLELKYQDLKDTIHSRFHNHRQTVEPILEKLRHFQMMVDYTNTYISCLEAEANAFEVLPISETMTKHLDFLRDYRMEESALQTFDLKIETQPVEELKNFVSGLCRLVTHQSNASKLETFIKTSSTTLSPRRGISRNERPSSINLKSATETNGYNSHQPKFFSPQTERTSIPQNRSLSDSTDSYSKLGTIGSGGTVIGQNRVMQTTSPTTKENIIRAIKPALQSPRSYASPKVSPRSLPAPLEKTSPILNRGRSPSPRSAQRQKFSPPTPGHWSPPSKNLSKLPSPVETEMKTFFASKSMSFDGTSKARGKEELGYSEKRPKSVSFDDVTKSKARVELKFSERRLNLAEKDFSIAKPTTNSEKDFSDLFDMSADNGANKSTTANADNHALQIASKTSPKTTKSSIVQCGDISCPEFLFDTEKVHEEREVTDDKRTLTNHQPKTNPDDSESEECFFLYKGTVGTYSFKDNGRYYFEVAVSYAVHQPLEQTWMVFEIGLCRLDDIDCYHSVERHPNARSFYVARYPDDGKLAQEFWHNRQLLECIPLSNNTSGTTVNVVYGNLIDTRKKAWTVFNCSKGKHLYTFKDIDFSVPLFPVFGTYNPELVNVELTLKTGKEAEPSKVIKLLK